MQESDYPSLTLAPPPTSWVTLSGAFPVLSSGFPHREGAHCRRSREKLTQYPARCWAPGDAMP